MISVPHSRTIYRPKNLGVSVLFSLLILISCSVLLWVFSATRSIETYHYDNSSIVPLFGVPRTVVESQNATVYVYDVAWLLFTKSPYPFLFTLLLYPFPMLTRVKPRRETHPGYRYDVVVLLPHSLAHYEYDPFGNTIHKSGSYADENKYRFSTKPIDEATGLYYYGYRFYDPVTGRWISKDPSGESGGDNLFGFVGNSPISIIDYLGLNPSINSLKTEPPEGLYFPSVGDNAKFVGWKYVDFPKAPGAIGSTLGRADTKVKYDDVENASKRFSKDDLEVCPGKPSHVRLKNIKFSVEISILLKSGYSPNYRPSTNVRNLWAHENVHAIYGGQWATEMKELLVGAHSTCICEPCADVMLAFLNYRKKEFRWRRTWKNARLHMEDYPGYFPSNSEGVRAGWKGAMGFAKARETENATNASTLKFHLNACRKYIAGGGK